MAGYGTMVSSGRIPNITIAASTTTTSCRSVFVALLALLSIHCGCNRIGDDGTSSTTSRSVDGNNGRIGIGMGMAMAFSPPRFTPRIQSPSMLAVDGSRIREGVRHGMNDHDISVSVRSRHDTSRMMASSASNLDAINGDIAREENIASGDSQGDLTGSNHYDDEVMATTSVDRQTEAEKVFDAVVNARYACTRFQRYQEQQQQQQQHGNGQDFQLPSNDKASNTTISTTTTAAPTASLSNPSIVHSAHECLALSQRAPTGFNAQPYRIVLVHTPQMKERLAEYCLGRNADRVRDSDCTAVFLADRECGRDGRRFEDFLVKNMDEAKEEVLSASNTTIATSRTRRPLSKQALFKLRMLILLFSSGYPLPRFLSVPISFAIRTGVSILSFFARCLHSMKQSAFFQRLSRLLPDNIQLLPTLSSATTWSQKNTMLVAMTYMLACTSRGLATCPMEGVDANGVRKVLGVSRGGRFSIPLIVSTGIPYRRRKDSMSEEEEETDDVGISHGGSGGMLSPRYPMEEVVYGNAFGKPFLV